MSGSPRPIDATAQVLKDGTTFTLRKEGGDVAGFAGGCRRVSAIANNMLTMDEPDHTRLRSIVDEAFRRRAIVAMEPRIRVHRRRARRQAVCERQPGRHRPALCAQPAAVGHLRIARPAFGRSAEIHRLGEHDVGSLTECVSFFRLMPRFARCSAIWNSSCRLRACRAARA